MSESMCIDSPLRGQTMPKVPIPVTCGNALSKPLKRGASRHEAAERFGVSVSSAVKWLQRWKKSRSASPKPRGRSVSPLEKVAARILALVSEQPDLTLLETITELRKLRIRTSRSSLWRFLDRHNITLIFLAYVEQFLVPTLQHKTSS
jgi:transposase